MITKKDANKYKETPKIKIDFKKFFILLNGKTIRSINKLKKAKINLITNLTK